MQRLLVVLTCLVASLGTGCTVVGAATGAAISKHPAAGAVEGGTIGVLVDIALIVAVSSLGHAETPTVCPPNCSVRD